jgi:hypothetical protein
MRIVFRTRVRNRYVCYIYATYMLHIRYIYATYTLHIRYIYATYTLHISNRGYIKDTATPTPQLYSPESHGFIYILICSSHPHFYQITLIPHNPLTTYVNPIPINTPRHLYKRPSKKFFTKNLQSKVSYVLMYVYNKERICR